MLYEDFVEQPAPTLTNCWMGLQEVVEEANTRRMEKLVGVFSSDC